MSVNNKGGRPSKYPTIDLEKVEQYAALGLIEDVRDIRRKMNGVARG